MLVVELENNVSPSNQSLVLFLVGINVSGRLQRLKALDASIALGLSVFEAAAGGSGELKKSLAGCWGICLTSLSSSYWAEFWKQKSVLKETIWVPANLIGGLRDVKCYGTWK